jgi:hypothetical protein
MVEAATFRPGRPGNATTTVAGRTVTTRVTAMGAGGVLAGRRSLTSTTPTVKSTVAILNVGVAAMADDGYRDMEIHARELLPGDLFGDGEVDHIDVRDVWTHRPAEVRVYLRYDGEAMDLPMHYLSERDHIWIRRPEDSAHG